MCVCGGGGGREEEEGHKVRALTLIFALKRSD